jgi:hypothetical protein
VLGTGWFGAVAAEAGPGKTVAASLSLRKAQHGAPARAS